MEPNSQDFVFQYEIKVDDNGIVQFTETEKNTRDAKKLLPTLWERIKGN
jgi:inner membrane protein